MHKQPALAADCVVFDKAGRLLLIRRKNPPFQGQYALPGGFVEYGERMEDAALRELREETGIAGKIVRLVGVYSRPDRDPRGHCVSAVYLVDAGDQSPVAGDDAAAAEFVENYRAQRLAFDHDEIVADALAQRSGAKAS
ncbi:MAG: NUDIX hydrolase [Xanthobacteraceae bacterium]|nr:NUDIX hydrolase [Xanthobacteraceae bacterium]